MNTDSIDRQGGAILSRALASYDVDGALISNGRRKESRPDPALELRSARTALERIAKSSKPQSPAVRALIAGLRAEVQWWSRKAGTRIAGVYTARDDQVPEPNRKRGT